VKNRRIKLSNKQAMTKILFTTAVLLTLFSCGQSTKKNEKEEAKIQRIAGWELLEEEDYWIQYPKDWELSQSGQMGTKFMLFSALENDEDKFRENVNLLTQDLGSNKVDLDQYTEISEKQIKTMLTNCTVYESTRIKNAGGECQKLVYAADQGTLRLKFEQLYWIENDIVYVLTFTFQESKFSSFKKIGEKIMTTFRLR
jgi:hypothetical protein